MSQSNSSARPTRENGTKDDARAQSAIERLWPIQFASDHLCGPDSDTDADNSTVPEGRRWAWYCKLPGCPKYYSAWVLKSNFLLHLLEAPAHQNDPSSKTREGRHQLASTWREETDYALTEPLKKPPTGARHDQVTEALLRQAGGDPNLAVMMATRPLSELI